MKNTMKLTTRTSPSATILTRLAGAHKILGIVGILGVASISLGSTSEAAAQSAAKLRQIRAESISGTSPKPLPKPKPKPHADGHKTEEAKGDSETGTGGAQKASFLPPDPCGITEENPDCNGNGIGDSCDLLKGFADDDRNGVLDLCQFATGDLDLDGMVDASDLSLVLAGWGAAGVSGDCNDDGFTNSEDLSIILANWSTQG